jgi:hypothetical protein
VVSDSLEYNPERLQVIEYLKHTVEEAVLLAVVIQAKHEPCAVFLYL